MWSVCVLPRRGFMDSQSNPDAVAWTPRRQKPCGCVSTPTPGLVAGVFAWGTRRFAWGTRHFAWGTRRASAPKFSGQEQCNFGLRGSGLQVSSHVSSFLLASILQASILQASILQASILQASIHRAHVSSSGASGLQWGLWALLEALGSIICSGATLRACGLHCGLWATGLVTRLVILSGQHTPGTCLVIPSSQCVC